MRRGWRGEGREGGEVGLGARELYFQDDICGNWRWKKGGKLEGKEADVVENARSVGSGMVM